MIIPYLTKVRLIIFNGNKIQTKHIGNMIELKMKEFCGNT